MNLHTNMKENRPHLEININAKPEHFSEKVKHATLNLSNFSDFIIYVQKHTNLR